MTYRVNIEKATLANNSYRKVLFTTHQQQLVVMSLPPRDFIPRENHKKTTQFIRIEKGFGIAIIDDIIYNLIDGIVLMIPPNTWHYIENTGSVPLKLYTIYSPPEHDPNLIQINNPMT